MKKDNRNELGEEKVSVLLFKLALPAIIAQLVNVLYNIIDRIFIGKLPSGDMAMAGVGVAFPIITLISAFSALIGMGGAPLAAIKMGEKDNDGAEEILSNSFSMIIFISIILTVFFSIFKRPILMSFGGSESTIEYAISYLQIYLIGTICVQISLGMNPFINTQGFAKIGMTTVMIGAVVNIILDPIFIFTFNLGVKGAALASVLGQLLSSIYALKFLFGKKSILKIRKKYIIPKYKVVLSIVSLGISPFIMQSTESLVLISQNNQLLKFGGDLYVSAMTIMSSIMQIVTLPAIGLCQGAQPIISYNYGAKNMERVKGTFKLLLTSCVLYTMTISLSLILFPSFFVKIFNSNSELLDVSSSCIKIFFVGMTVFGGQIACQQTFLALGKAKISLILACLRKIILLIPLTFIVPIVFNDKVLGTLLAEPISDITATITTTICFYIISKKIFEEKINDLCPNNLS